MSPGSVDVAEDLADLRVLVVEDEFLIAMIVEDVLAGLGCQVVGPVGGLEPAKQLARDESLDAAILDVNIHGGQVFPVAEILLARRVPFVLASGYGDWSLPQALQGQLRLTKPFIPADVERAMRTVCKGH